MRSVVIGTETTHLAKGQGMRDTAGCSGLKGGICISSQGSGITAGDGQKGCKKLRQWMVTRKLFSRHGREAAHVNSERL